MYIIYILLYIIDIILYIYRTIGHTGIPMGFHWPRLSLDHADEDEAVARRFAELREQYEEVCLGLPWDTKGLTLLDVGW